MKYKNILSGAVLASVCGIASAAQVVINDPTYSNSYFESNPGTQTIVYGIGVYETRSDHEFGYHPVGEAYIDIQSQGDSSSILVLSSYEPTNWNISGSGLESLEAVYVFGYHDQSVTISNASISIYEYSYEATGNYLGIAYSWDDPDISTFEGVVGDNIDAFAGSYRATSFTISSAVPVPPSFILFASSLIGLGILRKKNA